MSTRVFISYLYLRERDGEMERGREKSVFIVHQEAGLSVERGMSCPPALALVSNTLVIAFMLILCRAFDLTEHLLQLF